MGVPALKCTHQKEKTSSYFVLASKSLLMIEKYLVIYKLHSTKSQNYLIIGFSKEKV